MKGVIYDTNGISQVRKWQDSANAHTIDVVYLKVWFILRVHGAHSVETPPDGPFGLVDLPL